MVELFYKRIERYMGNPYYPMPSLIIFFFWLHHGNEIDYPVGLLIIIFVFKLCTVLAMFISSCALVEIMTYNVYGVQHRAPLHLFVLFCMSLNIVSGFPVCSPYLRYCELGFGRRLLTFAMFHFPCWFCYLFLQMPD